MTNRYIAGIRLSANGLVIEPHFIGLEHVKAKHRGIYVEFDKKELKIKSDRDFTLRINGISTEYAKGEHVIRLMKL